jgi:hypothetical protein
MGLLDDAIREHLELKRRHGAPEEDVRRLEEEALGPVRPGGEYAAAPAQEGDALEAAEAGEDEPAGEPEPMAEAPPRAPEPHVVPAPEPVAPDAPAAAEDEAAEPEAASEEPRLRPVEEPPPTGFVPGESWLDEADEVPPGEALDHAQPTVEFTPPDVAPEDAPPAGEPPAEDVLEETPEFLQETPDHDRLWFEQKPPRDFDFDK